MARRASGKAGLGGRRGFVLDLDGVVYRGSAPVPGAREFVDHLRKTGRQVFFLTNASFRSRAGTAEKLHSMGIECGPDEVISASYAAAHYVKAKWGKCEVLVVGERGIHEEMKLAGIDTSGRRPEKCKAVVVGLDRQINYEKLCRALDALRAGAELIACNEDASFPMENRIVPGAGAMVGALEKISGKRAHVVGKPSKFMMHLCVRKMGLKPAQVAVVGDRLETDILMANREGAYGILVLTGVCDAREAARARKEMRPRLVAENLHELSRML